MCLSNPTPQPDDGEVFAAATVILMALAIMAFGCYGVAKIGGVL